MEAVFILGINGRCGTNFLYRTLLLHPNIKRSQLSHEDYLIAESYHLINYLDAVLDHQQDDWYETGRDALRAKLLKSLGQGLLNALAGENRQKISLTKTPSTECLDNFFQIFPDSKLILLVRNGKDNVESFVKSFDYDYQLVMHKYADGGQRIIDFQHQWLSKQEQFLLVYYENLVRFTKLEANRIFDFIGLDPTLVTEEQLNSLPIYGSSTSRGGQKEIQWNPIYDKSGFNPLARSANWNEELHQQFEHICGDIYRELGYDSKSNLPTTIPTPATSKVELQSNSSFVSTTTYASALQLSTAIARELLRKLWFSLGEKEASRFLYRRILESATAVKADIIGPKLTYHNETRNDRWIVEYVFPGKRDGYFLEAGAANGIGASSCYVLETEFDWQGICIEPHTDFFQQLVHNRPESICENICLAEKEGQVVYVKGDKGNSDAYLSGIQSNLEQFKYKGEEIVARGEKIDREAVTLEALLKKHNAPKIIDYAAFDIEGSELKVLEVFPFDEYTFLALSLECDRAIRKPITKLLKSHGYREIKNPFNRDMPWERYWLHKSFHNEF